MRKSIYVRIFILYLSLLASCTVIKDSTDPYNVIVRVIEIKKVKGGQLVTVKNSYMLYQRLFQTLPDSVVVGKVLVMPVFKRIK
jgi:hypothetical protein